MATKKYHHEYYLKNKEKFKKYMHVYYLNNKDEINKKKKEYRIKNKEKNKTMQRKWYLKNRERILEERKQYHIDNREKIKKYQRKYYQKNKEKIKQWYLDNREYLLVNKRSYYKENIGKIKEYNEKNRIRANAKEKERSKKRRKIDIKYKTSMNISRQIRKSLRNNKKGRHWEDLVGYSLSDLIIHLKKTLPEGYNWEDYLEGKLHIDHIIPVAVWNYDNPEHIDFKRCWALKNLQLLPAKENLRKQDKLLKPFQLALKIKFEVIK
jgi:hypothetical protein